MKPLIAEQQLLSARRVLYMTHLAIGDYIYQGVWLRALKRKYPHLDIDIWFDDCRRKPHSWAAFRNVTLGDWLERDGSFAQIFPIVDSLEGRDRQIQAAADRDYDLIVFVGKNRTEQFARVARRISRTAFLVATQSGFWRSPLAKAWYFRGVDAQLSFDQFSTARGRITEIYAGIFEAIFGLSASDAEGRQLLELKVDADHQAFAASFLQSAGTPQSADAQKASSQRVFLNHLSTADRKDYPWSALTRVVTEIRKRFGDLEFIVNAPPNKFDQVAADIASDWCPLGITAKAFTAKGSFFELPAVMDQCDIVISVDTATSHIAAALDKPQVVVMADDLKLWQPPGNSLILEGQGRAESVAPERIVDAFSTQFESGAPKSAPMA